MLPLKPCSAVDAISPAMDRTAAQLFKPFRFRHWLRLALLATLMGEFGGTNYPTTNFNLPSGTGSDEPFRLAGNPDPWQFLLAYWPMVLGALVVVIAFGLVFSYMESVFRFVLLDSVLHGRTEIGAGWRRWQEKGSSYFLWQLALSLALLVVLAVVAGVPLYSAWESGALRDAGKNFGKLLAGLFGAFVVTMLVLAVGTLIASLARDFVVPLMATEDLTVTAGWRRFLPMLAQEKGGYTAYVLMKVVLSIGSALLFSFVNAFAVIFLAIPLGILGVVVFLAAKAAGLTWTLGTVLAAGGLGLLVVAAVLFLVCFLYVPGLIFFQAYPLHFLAGRVPAIGAALFPAPEPPPDPPPDLSSPAAAG